ncbi:MAG: Gfo/Idh/MocA family protein [Acidimicrobiales bacterium]
MTLRIGILGAAAIAPKALVVPASEIDGVEVVAVAARDPKRAEAFAAEHNIPSIEPDYRSLCRADYVDAVYIALPASHHKPWAIEALRVGKDVLCEKPVAMNAVEAAEMVAVADDTGQLLMEAFHWRYHPLADRMKELVDTRLGQVESVSARFAVPIPDKSNIRYQLELGGGALMDLGCYPLQWVRYLLSGEPVITEATATQDPEGVDVSLTAKMRFDDHGGVPAEIHCAMAAGTEVSISLTAVGSDGTLEVTNPLAPQSGNLLSLTTAAGTETERIESASTYHHQLVAFMAAIKDSTTPPTSGVDSVANMAAIDDCYRAAGMQPRGVTI